MRLYIWIYTAYFKSVILMLTNNHNFCVILAGGRGKRMWPCSRWNFPKQFIDFFGTGRTQLQQTFDRFAQVIPIENIFVTINDEFAPIAMEQLPELPADHFLGEPINRNTAPSVTWACYHILGICPDANVIITPSDQAIINDDAFKHDVTEALDFVNNHEGIIAMGVRPSRPEPGYGYVQMGDHCQCGEDNLFTVKSFSEKPERDFARMFMDSGEFLWNTGIFVSNVKYMITHFKQVMPMVFRQIETDGKAGSLEEETNAVWEYFPLFPNLSIDYGILENADDAYVMLCSFGWADMGTWHSIYEAEQKCEGDNVVLDSEVIMEDCKDNIIKLPKGRLGVFNGLHGFIIAEKDNVLMICPKGDSSAPVRKFVNEVQMRLGDEFI